MSRPRADLPRGTFYLAGTPNKQGTQAIYLRYFVRGKYCKKTTDIWVTPDEWDATKQEVRSKNRSATKINNKLREIKKTIDDQLISYKDGVITPKVVNDMMAGAYLPIDQKAKNADFCEYAYKVNELMYGKNDYGYSVYYNSSLDIRKFAEYIITYCKREPIKISEMTLDVLQNYVVYRRDVRGCKSMEGVNKSLTPLIRAIKYAMNNGIMPVTQAAPIVECAYVDTKARTYNPEKEGEEKVKYLSPEQLNAFQNYTPKNSFSSATRDIMDIFLFSFYACGLRVSDLVTLEWSQIDFAKCTINKVQVKTKQKAKIQPMIAPEGMDILKKWKDKGLSNRFVFALMPNDFVFEDSKESQAELKKHINSATRLINQSLNAIGKNLNFPFPLSIHVARHTFCVSAISSGVSLHVVSQIMGHSSILSTEKTYAEYLETTVQKEMDKVHNIYKH